MKFIIWASFWFVFILALLAYNRHADNIRYQEICKRLDAIENTNLPSNPENITIDKVEWNGDIPQVTDPSLLPSNMVGYDPENCVVCKNNDPRHAIVANVKAGVPGRFVLDHNNNLKLDFKKLANSIKLGNITTENTTNKGAANINMDADSRTFSQAIYSTTIENLTFDVSNPGTLKKIVIKDGDTETVAWEDCAVITDLQVGEAKEVRP